MASFLPLITVILSGFVLSAMGTPIFVYRYMIPALGYYRSDCEVYLYEAQIDKLLPDMLESIRDNAQDETVLSLLDSILIERYWINVYELHL